jgi:hypothetical protein
LSIASAMHKNANDSPCRRHTLSDWLALHELDPVACRRILDAISLEVATAPVRDERPALERDALCPESAWLRTADAMRAFFPAQRSIIDDTFEGTVKTLVNQSNKPRRALTLDNGPTAFPTIIYSYRGEASDCLIISHEFAHALQIRASAGKFVPPIIREVCAFLGEWTLLSHAKSTDAAQHRRLSQVWHNDNRKFFGSDRRRLASALLRLEMPYSYSWNYPIARYLAIRTSQRYSRDQMWTLFEGDLSVQQILRELAVEPGA